MATVTLDLSGVRNRIGPQMAAELKACFEMLSEDDGLRLVVLTANGDDFSAGREEMPSGLTQPAAARWISEMRVASAVADLPAPVLVALNGDALAHGMELALAGDIRIAAAGARLGFGALSSTMFPWDGGTQRLPRLVGSGWALDLLLTGREVGAAEACSIGLVNRVVDGPEQLAETARELAETICSASPLGARYVKEAIAKGMDLPLDAGLRLEADLNVILQSTADREEGIKSFLEKRSPKFTGE